MVMESLKERSTSLVIFVSGEEIAPQMLFEPGEEPPLRA